MLQFLSSLPSLQSWMPSHLCDVVKQRLESHKKPGQVLGVAILQPIGSSEPSIQSLVPSQKTPSGTHPPYAHWYWLLEQVMGLLVVFGQFFGNSSQYPGQLTFPSHNQSVLMHMEVLLQFIQFGGQVGTGVGALVVV